MQLLFVSANASSNDEDGCYNDIQDIQVSSKEFHKKTRNNY